LLTADALTTLCPFKLERSVYAKTLCVVPDVFERCFTDVVTVVPVLKRQAREYVPASINPEGPKACAASFPVASPDCPGRRHAEAVSSLDVKVRVQVSVHNNAATQVTELFLRKQRSGLGFHSAEWICQLNLPRIDGF
jgi:hypothetical protein